MEVIREPGTLRARSDAWHREGRTVGLVPTMGALHEGHLALVRAARQEADRVVVSIFVNPTQFGPSEDFARYPRDLDRDLKMLEPLQVDAVFAPGVQEMYPPGFQTRVDLEHLPRHLCGLSRPHHFGGVALVVTKLFAASRADLAVFGLKDYQQVRVIERLVADLDLGVRIVRHPTVREHDGLAMSSRNLYLTAEERTQAPALYRVLRDIGDRVRQGQEEAGILREEGIRALESAGFRVEYFSLCDPETLEEKAVARAPLLVAAAARLGNTRLIDNLEVSGGAEPVP